MYVYFTLIKSWLHNIDVHTSCSFDMKVTIFSLADTFRSISSSFLVTPLYLSLASGLGTLAAYESPFF